MRFEWKTASGGPEKHSASGTRVYCSLGAECPSQWPPFVEPAGVARYSAIAQVPDHPLPFDFLQKDLHPVRGPGRNAAVKEVGVLRPDRATKDKRRSQDRPIFLIAMNEALPGILLKTVVGFRFNHLDQAMKGSKIANAGTASNLHLSRIMGRCSRASSKAMSGQRNRHARCTTSRGREPSIQALRESGCWHPEPRFSSSDFAGPGVPS